MTDNRQKWIDTAFLCIQIPLFVLGIALMPGCAHNVHQLGAGSEFRVGSGEFSLSYKDGLFLNSVNRENTKITAEIDSTVGASYDPVTGSFKGIKSITIETGPQFNGYTVDAAKESPDTVAAYYDALKAYYQSKTPDQPLISDDKSKAATSGVSEIIKEAIDKAKSAVSGDADKCDDCDTPAPDTGKPDDDCADGSCSILPAVSAVASALLTDTSTEYRWYYADTTKNETSAALQAAIGNKCGLLVFVGNPGCSVCEGVWGSAMMDGPGKMAKYLEENKLVGLYVEDSTTHYQKLANGARGYKNPDGSRTESGPPFLVFVKVKDDCVDVTSLNFSGSTSVVDVFFCGSTGNYLPVMDYANVTRWLADLMKSDAYKNAWQ